jgi:hypothetical protein
MRLLSPLSCREGGEGRGGRGEGEGEDLYLGYETMGFMGWVFLGGIQHRNVGGGAGPREYEMIYRGPGFLAVVCDLAPRPPPPPCSRQGYGGPGAVMRQQESLVL